MAETNPTPETIQAALAVAVTVLYDTEHTRAGAFLERHMELLARAPLAEAVCRDLDAWRQTMAGSAQMRAWFSARYALFSSFSRWHHAASSPAAGGVTGDDGEGDGD